jgi:hypothetical protein
LVSAIPYIGYLVTFIKTPRGFAVFIGGPALFLLLLQIRKIKEGIEEEVRRRTAKYIEEEKKKNSVKPPIPLIILLLLLLIPVGILPIAYARFTAAATIHNVAFTTAQPPAQTPTPTAKPTPTCPYNVTVVDSGVSHTTSIAIANTGNNTIDGNASGSGTITTGDATATSVVNTTMNNTTIHCPPSGVDN